MAVAPERQRKEDYNRWREAHAKRQQLTPPSMSWIAKRIKHMNWHDCSEEEHF